MYAAKVATQVTIGFGAVPVWLQNGIELGGGVVAQPDVMLL